MKVTVNNRVELVHELRMDANLSGAPLSSEPVTQDISELIEETFVRGVMSERLPLESDELFVDVETQWQQEPIVKAIKIQVTVPNNGSHARFGQSYSTGRWGRSARLAAMRLREEGTLAEDQIAHPLLIGLKRADPPELKIPPIAPPPIVERSLEDFGIRQLGSGELVPDRPVLVSQRMASDAVRKCEEADATETGGAVLGTYLRLEHPLPGTETRIVTVLSTIVEDPRHVGAPLSFTFSPEGLVAAAQFADLRGLGENVQTVFHTHGWSNACGNCNQNPNCPLAECNVSLQDYSVLESLLPSKSTLMPIAGRKLGEAGRRPVLQIHAWRGGEMKPIRWQAYSD